MRIIAQIKEPIREEMELFEQKFRGAMSSKVALLNCIIYYIINRKGKQMCPMFISPAAKMLLGGKVTECTYRGASVTEPIHIATLVHDDVVDDNNKRRGFFSTNTLWKNRIAALIGDYLLSKGLLLSVDNGDFDLLRIISVVVQEMSEGELLQMEKARRLDIVEEVYYEAVRQKTATLIAMCCAMGACSAMPNTPELIEKMRPFGEYMGMALQVKDDPFDYTEDAIEKPTDIDTKEQKMILPPIYVLNTCIEEEKKWLADSVKEYNKDKKRVKEIISFVKTHNGLEYATVKMKDFQQKALSLLDEFPASAYKESLIPMVNYVVNKNI